MNRPAILASPGRLLETHNLSLPQVDCIQIFISARCSCDMLTFENHWSMYFLNRWTLHPGRISYGAWASLSMMVETGAMCGPLGTDHCQEQYTCERSVPLTGTLNARSVMCAKKVSLIVSAIRYELEITWWNVGCETTAFHGVEEPWTALCNSGEINP